MSKPAPSYAPHRESNFSLPDVDLDAALPWLEDPEPAQSQPSQDDAEWAVAA